MKRAWLVVAWLLVFMVGAELAPPSYVQTALAQQEEPSSPRARAPVTFLQINDVYSTVPIDGIADAAPYVLRMFGGGKIGFIGMCLNTSEITSDKLTHTRIVDPLEAAARYLPLLKQEGTGSSSP